MKNKCKTCEAETNNTVGLKGNLVFICQGCCSSISWQTFKRMVLNQYSVPYNQILPDPSDFRDRRQQLGLTLEDVAKGAGVSVSTVGRLERGNDTTYIIVKSIHDYLLGCGG